MLDDPFLKEKVPRENLAKKALRIKTQVIMQKTEDFLMAFTKPEYKNHRPNSRKRTGHAGEVLRKAGCWRERVMQKGIGRRGWVRRKSEAKEPSRTKCPAQGRAFCPYAG